MVENEFELLPRGEMQKKYHLYSDNWEFLNLNKDKFPGQFIHFISYAEIWGISNDIMREDFVEKTPIEEGEKLVKAITLFENELIDWLGDRNNQGEELSEEYLALSDMMEAYDSMKFRLMKMKSS